MADAPVQDRRHELTVSRTASFSAAHRLYNPAWSEEKNVHVYGKCSREGGHGHNYTLTLRVCGRHDRATGMVVNVTLLHEMLQREVVDQLDHRDLNTDVPFLADVIPTMENLAVKIAERLAPCLAPLGVAMRSLELAESATNRVILEYL